VISLLGVNPLRAEILKFLFENREGGTSGDIGRSVGTGYRTILWHLNQLEELGAVVAHAGERRIGQRVVYTINVGAFDSAASDLISYIKGQGADDS
jgi:DNA-binding transcriptional ArsR family regulator